MKRSKKTFKELLPVYVGIIAFFISIFFSFGILKFIGKADEEKQYSTMITIAEKANAEIYGVLMRNLSKVFSLTALATDDGTIPPEMEKQLEGMIKGSQISGFVFAPKGIVQGVYPYESNKSLIGKNFLNDFSNLVNSSVVKSSTEPYFIGPYESSFGNYKLITIISPIFRFDPNGKRSWWGIVAVAVDFDVFMEQIDISDINKQGYACKIWKHNDITNRDLTIVETESPVTGTFNKKTVTFQKKYFQDEWNYTLEPIKKNLSPIFYVLAIIFVVLDIFSGFAIYYVVKGLQSSESERLYKMQSKLVQMQEHTIISLSSLVENRDSDTGEHVRRTSDYVYMLAKEAKKRGIYADILTDDYIEILKAAAPMHDIGKIVVPDAVLKKPGRLTPEEFIEIRKHTVEGGRIIQDVIGPVQTPEYVRAAREIAVYHHEKWDGTGYPYGLAKEDIPVSARIMALADVFDALTTPRCYKAPFSFEKSMEIINMESRFHFDPALVDVFVACENELKSILKKYNK